MESFAAIPPTVEWLLTGAAEREPLSPEALGSLHGRRYERVLLVYFDAFGWFLAERHADHPLFARARDEGVVHKLTSQFPSTTAAHVPTVHTGLPVGEHGVYEWFILEPSLDRLIAPLLFAFAGDKTRNTLRGRLAPADVFPTDTLYSRLAPAGVRSHVAQSSGFTPGPASDVLLRGATVHPFVRPAEGLAQLTAALAGPAPTYALFYLDGLDSLMHAGGPDDPRVPGEIERALTLVEQALSSLPEGTLVLLTADHGMSPVSPESTIYVNRIWPELERHLRRGADGKPLAPAGSCRDLFLHVLPGRVDDVCAGLRERLDGRAEVLPVASLVASGLFGSSPSERLLTRLGDVVVLPELGEAVFWHEPGRFEQLLRGQHGGLSPVEREIPLVALMT